jgi:hypothetical protein
MAWLFVRKEERHMNASNSADHAAGAELQGELRDLLCLAVVGDNLRWVVRGDSGELGRWLSDAVLPSAS